VSGGRKRGEGRTGGEWGGVDSRSSKADTEEVVGRRNMSFGWRDERVIRASGVRKQEGLGVIKGFRSSSCLIFDLIDKNLI